MGRSQEALAEPELISWARDATHTPVEDAAKSAGVPVDRLKAWEEGSSRPTVRQLRALAHRYGIPFAAFYLPSPPDIRLPRFRSYRSSILDDATEDALLFREIRFAIDAAQVMVELSDPPPSARLPEIQDGTAEEVAATIRSLLGLTVALQTQWREERVAFNKLRSLAEDAGLMVMQTSAVPIEVFRALSIPDRDVPCILLNRKDSYAGRSFSILHELSHLLSGVSAICSMVPTEIADPASRATETFCNAAAAAAFVPNVDFHEAVVSRHGSSDDWSDLELHRAARRYGCSREVILRKLLDLGIVSEEVYESRRRQYLEQFRASRSRAGFVAPATDRISLLGHRYMRTLVSALDRGEITPNDFSDYAGLRLKHLDTVRETL